MKEIIRIFLIMSSMIVMLNSCSASEGPKKVAGKIENNEQLTKEDYDIMMDYIMDKATSVFENIRNGDEEGSVGAVLELKDDELFNAFEKILPSYEEAVIQYLMFGFNPKEIDRSRYYPASIKGSIINEVVEEVVRETVTTAVPIEEEYVNNGFQTDEEGNYIMSHNPLDYDYHFKGIIGNFPIELHFSYDMDTMDGVELIGFYTEAGNTLDLRGEKKDNGEVTLEEFTMQGINIGIFNLEFSHQDLVGKFTNKYNGETSNVKLTSF